MSISEQQDPPGAVELREDAPLRSGTATTRLCAGGPRAIAGGFAVLTAAVTVALLTQIYYGDYEVVPHGSVSSSAAACSRAGAASLRTGGRAVDAAVTAALCLAVLEPHRTSLDASGSLVYWEYRSSRTQPPTAVEWGGPEVIQSAESGSMIARTRPPRLLVALAALHAQMGMLPWAAVVKPVIDLAREGYVVSESMSSAATARGMVGFTAAALRTEPSLANYLETLVHNTSSDLCESWACDNLRRRTVASVSAGAWRIWAAGAGASSASALSNALALDLPQLTPAVAFERVVKSLQQQVQLATATKQNLPTGVASGLAIVDPQDTYLALVTGLSTPFGSGPAEGAWTRDEPSAPLDLAPAIITDQHVCGTRYIMGAESSTALAEGAAGALAGGGASAVDAVESTRVLVLADGSLASEPGRPALALSGPLPPGAPDALPQPALNFVQQRGDTLLSHADSRGGGLASRF